MGDFSKSKTVTRWQWNYLFDRLNSNNYFDDWLLMVLALHKNHTINKIECRAKNEAE